MNGQSGEATGAASPALSRSAATGFGRALVSVATLAVFSVASGCGLFDTEYEPVQKGQQVLVDAGPSTTSENSGNSAGAADGSRGAAVTAATGPSGATSVSAPPGASGPSGSADATPGSGTSGGSPAQPPTSDATVTTVPDPVIATVPHLPVTAPDFVPPLTTTTIQTEDYQAFCQATAGLARVGQQLVDPDPAVDLAQYRDLFVAAMKYIVLVRDSYPNTDRSVFGPIIDAVNAAADGVESVTSTDAGVQIARDLNSQEAPAFDEIYTTRLSLCANATS